LKKRKLFEKILASAGNVRFNDLVVIIEAFGSCLSRVSGSHHIFVHPTIPELVNLQHKKGKAKPYQVR
jgi:predicted RNA binding protein YcfA (HicA-like mRNA interferase family)